MWEKVKSFASEFFVTGDPLIYGADVTIVLTIIAIVFGLTYFKKWGWLWREWLTTVDHKKIGIMYILSAFLMLFRGGVDALLMRAQLAMPELSFLTPDHYNQIFTTHGVIMILFMAMPFMFGLFNVVVPLQIGARDVAFPFLNALSFWLFFWGAMLFNLSFVIGGSPDAGWLAYPPYSERMFNPGVGQDFYIWGIQISGIGSLMTGINFIVTILKMRAPGMKLMKMPLFPWSVLSSCIAIIFSFPILTATLALLFLDRYLGAHFFTLDGGGNPMMYINLIWMWGHPEVYIIILPAFGIFSEIVSTFAKKKLFGYKSMVYAMMIISILSFLVWAHHFFTMGSGADVNAFFALTTMLIAIPTGVKVFNWLFTMFRGKITFETPMLWTIGFIVCFIIGGMTGVLLSVAPADFQFHNSYFLIAHFHNTIIGGVVFGYFAGLYYWWPKLFGFTLNERIGKWAFWFWNIGFYVCFMPQYVLGLMGMTRRLVTYGWDKGWWEMNLVSTIGAVLMGIAFLLQVWQSVYSVKYAPTDTTGDPWNGRTLEWSIPSPAPHYNFATLPQVSSQDEWWEEKQRRARGEQSPVPPKLEPIHMPRNSGIPFVMSMFWFTAGFGFVFDWVWLTVAGLAGVAVCMLVHSFNYNTDYYIPVEEITRTEAALRG
ncbi:cbb3-type cytochrome c oxidase subunit I [Paenibacillus thiaminolyticus]|uniref:Quinol oxidase polypeptide I n=1 Tax=Paenibacillus thiaminolyticus TaxID=49283 RepID=A0AAP9DRH1_PANTH|nr:cbb3-type cytochrome c oxidase subunit I [Paenibacillus thiaminolyticus]MCY9535554.1 cbb3-type cytochrome c oxidase subunit I [Paenibacillus thiaminolyticus]MCY9601673.1 cbb3-type cytochrome c oxidase subunit I [Paenibacillus thiaminolyticus]MCY9610710.1 cbb3-type cytochrome c oxidase subunit I [Paenibacillus thiaminolyticus]MCY9615877.1 cbb3-type cytochrome c oxidase subunit I [Paenibacillus thiaminolyticus]MCY9622120.1 cbb3-type cytochrome c oxidase subunit I [Paenibacillus thiaminolyticu